MNSPSRSPARPFLLVLDAFEEIQYRTKEDLDSLWTLLRELQRLYPALRVVICGRVPPSTMGGMKWRALELRDLDPVAATGFLGAHGIDDPEVARLVVEQVGANPLSLKLAAEVLKREGAGRKGIKDLKRTSFLFLSRRESAIQRELYRRILHHIHHPDVRNLAHPGLVLRKITPELIREVLAGPCGVDVPNMAKAQELFDELRREAALVVPDEEGALRHRQDVRRSILELLEHDKPAQARAIHEAAVHYYARQEGQAARAEEIYHRLQLGQSAMEVESRWIDGLAGYLTPAIEELPKPGRAFLAQKFGMDEVDHAAPKLMEWEQRTEQRARELLRADQAERALKLLRQRQERLLGSRLYAIEAAALDRLGDTDGANAILERGLKSAQEGRDLEALLELYPLAAEHAARREDIDAADRYLRRALEIAEHLRRQSAVVELLSQQVDVALRGGAATTTELSKASNQLLSVVMDTSDSELARDRKLLRRIVGQVGPQSDVVLQRALDILSIESQDSSVYLRLATALSGEGEARSEEAALPRTSILKHFASSLGISVETERPEGVQQVVEAAARVGALTELLRQVLQTGDAGPDVRVVVSEMIIKSGVRSEAS